MKKYLDAIIKGTLGGLVVAFGLATFAYAAPTAIYQRSVLPTVDNLYDLGTSTLDWNRAFVNYVSSTAISAGNFCITGGSCYTTLDGTFAWTPTTHFGVGVNSTSTPLWLRADVYASSTIRATTSTNQIVVFEPEGLQVITAASDTINGNLYSHYHISSDADYVMSSTPTIPDGVDGQMLILTNTSTLYTIDLQDESGLTGSNIILNGASATIKPQGTMTLLFDDVVSGWYVISNPTSGAAGANASTVRVRNVSGSAIAAGKVVYATGYNSGLNRITVDLADADDSTKMPAIGITTAQINNNANGDIVAFGNSVGVVNTIGTTVNQGVWVGTTAGEVVFTRPAVDNIQKIGLVTRVAAAGSVLVQGAGRTNDVPWIAQFSNVSSTQLSVYDNVYFGATATSTFGSDGALTLIGNLTFDSQVFDSLTDDITLANNSGDLQVVDVTCTDCLNATEIEDIFLLNSGDVGTGVYDFGGATSFEIPNAADPTVDATGELALNTTTSSLRYYDGTAERALYDVQYKTITFSTTTMEADEGLTASSTIPLGVASPEGETWVSIACYTSAGTAEIEFGDGTNWMDYQKLTTSLSTDTSLSNNTFTFREKRYIRVGQASSLEYATCSVGIRQNAS